MRVRVRVCVCVCCVCVVCVLCVCCVFVSQCAAWREEVGSHVRPLVLECSPVCHARPASVSTDRSPHLPPRTPGQQVSRRPSIHAHIHTHTRTHGSIHAETVVIPRNIVVSCRFLAFRKFWTTAQFAAQCKVPSDFGYYCAIQNKPDGPEVRAASAVPGAGIGFGTRQETLAKRRRKRKQSRNHNTWREESQYTAQLESVMYARMRPIS